MNNISEQREKQLTLTINQALDLLFNNKGLCQDKTNHSKVDKVINKLKNTKLKIGGRAELNQSSVLYIRTILCLDKEE